MDGARSSMSDRSALRAAFIDRAGWSDAEERLLAGDASFRKYYRLTRRGGTAVVMDAPAPQENVRPFVRIGRHLLGMKLSAPEIFAEDAANGFLLLEDLGDDTFARVLAAGGDEAALYARASVVFPAPSSPFRPMMSPIRRRVASVAPSWSVARSSGRDIEKAGICRCRLLSTRCPVGGYAPCGAQ